MLMRASFWWSQLDQPVAWLPDVVASSVEDDRVRYVRVEVRRFLGPQTPAASKVFVSARFGGLRLPSKAAGWEVRRTTGAASLIGEKCSLLLFESGEIEYTVFGQAISNIDAHASVVAWPLLAPFGAIALPPAELTQWGMGWSSSAGAHGLVTVRLDDERLVQVESALRSAGFGVPPDDSEAPLIGGEVSPTPQEFRLGDKHQSGFLFEAPWTTPDASHAVVWAGGTAYGYAGPVASMIGAWPDEADEDDSSGS